MNNPLIDTRLRHSRKSERVEHCVFELKRDPYWLPQQRRDVVERFVVHRATPPNDRLKRIGSCGDGLRATEARQDFSS